MPEPADSRRAARDPWSIGFGIVALAVAVLSLTVWFPNDIRGGFIDVNQRGLAEPGDAFFPVLLAGMILILGLVQVLHALLGRRPQAEMGRLSVGNLAFLFNSYAIVLAGLAVMYWLGPLVVEALRLAGALDQSYRELIDTVPYKYLGFVGGGLLMTVALIVRAEGRLRPRTLAVVAGVLAVLILVLDVLLYNIQLPPNVDH